MPKRRFTHTSILLYAIRPIPGTAFIPGMSDSRVGKSAIDMQCLPGHVGAGRAA